MTTLSTEVKVGGLTIKVEVTCKDSYIGWAKDCAKKLKQAVDAVKEEFGEKPGDGER